ncbi:hypothetical protein HOLleu_00853 [Holothuria leucospilota]|uniref:Uncharacterized protein n=1 Tax=Holothuria leucospilota TaxID=206669 RepID=A0A9Q1HKK9_HOLLE|nr:hypothetical protein HOLleu_00853 [Holothuria leucospilota]
MLVEHYGKLYGRDMITHNVHGLVHLSEDAKQFGPLDSIYCFPFENFLGQLKRMVRKPFSSLEQVVRRLSEHHPEIPCEQKKHSLRKPHFDGPIPRNVVVTRQYMELQTENYVVNISSGNNCIQVGSDIAIVHNFCILGEVSTVVYERFAVKHDFYLYPLLSSKLGVYKVSRPTGIIAFSMPSFAIVVFTEDNDAVSLVPEVWCIGKDNCYWPPYKSLLKFERAVR